MAMLVEHVIIPVFEDMCLKEAEAVAVDGSDEQGREKSEAFGALAFLNAAINPGLELGSRFFGECESDDRSG